ncbi:MAG: DUF429 domain-containing protein [Akkermansiaceae bacterium]|jgi:predicted RNase H-like nuclease|nr:DUF429 domain-containing protein [Akkermansiaceae bacterium]
MGQSSIIYTSSSLGVDGCKEGWVGVAIDECGQVLGSHVSSTFKNLLSYFPGIQSVGIDMPLKLINEPSKEADQLVRKELGSKRFSSYS